MKTLYFFIALISFILFSSVSFSQSIIKDTTNTQPTQYRRGVELQKGYQTYEQKYSGKNLLEEKKRLYPLGFPIGTGGTGHLGDVTTGTGVWTELNPKVPRVDYIGIHFINPDTCWACGDLGTIIKTVDGGSSWTVEQTNTTTPILKVNSYNGQLVIASGFSGLILRSSDGGETWTQMVSGVTGDLWGLQMINDTLGWAGGNQSSLTRTTDGGLTWQTVTTPGYTGNYWWIDFMNKNYGFIAGDGKVLRTTDGGSNWDIIQAGDAQSLYCVDVIDSLHIAAAGYGGTSYRGKNIYSSDGGNTWATGGMTTFDPINCIKYVNPDTGYFVMSEVGMWKTTDSGQHWTGIVGLNDIGEYEIQFLPGINIGYSAGISLKLFKAVNNLDVWHKLIINDDLSDVCFTNEQNGFAISEGTYGRLYKTTNNGVRWDTVQGVPGGGCITFTDSLTGYYGTSTSLIYKTTNGGESWYQTNGITNSIARIFFINYQTGWAVGGPRIFKTTDGGENWFEQLYNIIGSFNGISLVDSLYGWTSNLSEWLYKTTDSGQNWLQQTNSNIYSTRDIYFKDSLNGFAVKTNQLYETTDSGNNWNLNSYVSGFSFAKFSHYTDSTIFIVGYKVYRTIDGGNEWIEFPELDGKGLVNLSLVNTGLGYAVGNSGLIMKYYDSTYTPVELISFQAGVKGSNVYLNWSTATELNNKGFDIERKVTGDRSSVIGNWEKIGFVQGNGTTAKPHDYSFIDENITSGTYKYRLKQIDFDGTNKYSKEIEVSIKVPLHYSLNQNFPNPFNPTTTIKYSIKNDGFVTLKIYDILGREVMNLVNKNQAAGEHSINFNASSLPSGIYIYRLQSGGFVSSKKMVLLK